MDFQPIRDEPGPTFVAQTPAMVRVAEALHRVAATDVRVLLYGENGVGKTHAAHCLHAWSPRASRPFAHLSVRDREAAARLSDRGFARDLGGGTLLIQGVGEAPEDVQVMLVGWIEEWASEDEGRGPPVRIMATAQSDLLGAVDRGRFRADLYFLLDVFPVRIPPLRERLVEIPALVEHFYRRFAPDTPYPGLDPGFLEAAVGHRWTGNLRELENTVTGPLLGLQFGVPELPRQGALGPFVPFAQAKREFEREYVHRLLLVTGGNVTRASQLAGKARKDFYALMARNGVDPAGFRPGSPL